MSEFLDRLRQSSAFFSSNAPFIEDLFESYLKDPASVPDEWRSHFDTLPPVNGSPAKDLSHRRVQDDFLQLASDPHSRVRCSTGLSAVAAERQAKVLRLINAYRVRGHLVADLDPLGPKPQHHPELDPEYYGLTICDLDRNGTTDVVYGSWDRLLHVWDLPFAYDRANVPWPTSEIPILTTACSMTSFSF